MIAKFNTPLLVEELSEATDTKGADWRLFADFSYDSALLQRTIIVPAGFVTDFASVPRIPLAYWLTGGMANKPATIHDWLYRSCIGPRSDDDAVLKEAMGVIGQPAWRCEAMYAGVRAFGGKFYCSGHNPAQSGMGNAKAMGLPMPPPPNPKAIKLMQNRKLLSGVVVSPTVKEILF
jgi:Protein of unknown function (DUF1353)